MKESEFRLSDKEAEKGIRKLRRDIPVATNWLREKVTKKQLETESRPLGFPDTKYFDGHKYTFYGMVSDEAKARELANKVRKTGRYARIEPSKINGKWFVWRGTWYKK